MQCLPIIKPEFKSLIPPHTADERAQLEQNILLKRKCYDPIVLWEGYIIDGHVRFEICEEHGIEFKVVEIELACLEAAKLWILENQLARRSLTEAARIELAFVKTEILREKARQNLSDAGGDKKSGSPSTKLSKSDFEPIDVQKATAADADVSIGTLSRYQQLKKYASPELLAQVMSGAMKIGTAHRIVETEKKLKLADKMYKFMAKALIKCDEEAREDISIQMVELTEQLEGLVNALYQSHKYREASESHENSGVYENWELHKPYELHKPHKPHKPNEERNIYDTA